MLSVAPANAQPTWKGLAFGMSISDVSKTLNGQGYKVEAINPEQMRSTVDFELQIPGMTISYPFVITAHFSAKGLDIIDLKLDLNEMNRRNPKLGSDGAALAISASSLATQLTGKYGRPVQEGNCDDPEGAYIEGRLQHCSMHWSSEGQMVAFFWGFGSKDGPVLLIEYLPKPADEL
jgi:hypothetical protein